MREETVCKIDTEMPVHQFAGGAQKWRPGYGPEWPDRSSLTEKAPKIQKAKPTQRKLGVGSGDLAPQATWQLICVSDDGILIDIDTLV